MAIKRLHYFNGQFLKEQDFSDEQNYHLEMRRRLNQRLHAPGIVFGLEVIAGANKVTVQPGMAIDAQGREIILESATDLTITAAADITIAYNEEQTDESSETGVVGKRRWTETAVLVNAADPNGVVLAKVSTVSPVALNNAFRRPYSAPVLLGDLEVKRDLTVQGNLTVQGETTTVQTERMRGNVALGDEDADTVTLEGRLLTGHSSGRLQIGSPVQVTGDLALTGPLTLAGNPTAALHAAPKQYIDAHAGATNPHSGSLAKTGDTMSGALSITAGGTGLSVTNNVSVGGNVGVGTANPAEPLDVNGRVKSGSLTVGPWPVSSNYMFVGVNTLNQSVHMNYALLQGATAETGRTFLNSPVDIRFRIANTEQMILANNGNVGVGTMGPIDKLDVAGAVRVLTGSNPVRFTSAWSGFPDNVTNHAEICNDTGGFRTLMIVGNRSGGLGRRVSVWDVLEVNGNLAVSGAATKPGGGSWASASDKRLKKNVESFKAGVLDRLLKLRGVSYEWKEPEKFGNQTGAQIGFVADEVEEIFPGWVGVDAQGYKTLAIRGFEALAVEALREIEERNDALRRSNLELENRLRTLEKKLA